MLLFCISFGLWLVGYQSGFALIMATWFGGGGAATYAAAAAMIVAFFALILATVGGGTVSTGGIASGFGQIYIIPAMIITLVLVPFVLVPFSFLAEPALPNEIKMLLTGVFTILIIASFLGFVRGGEV